MRIVGANFMFARYHRACDTVANMNTQIFTENARAIAHVARYFGDRKVATLLEKASVRVASAKTGRSGATPLDRYHKDRRDRATR